MKPLYSIQWQRLQALKGTLLAFFDGMGYSVIDPPLLQPTELFARKSGGDLASRLYSFTDPRGAHVSLRPEFTASVIRAYIEHDAAAPLPVRYQYSGPVFRYQRATSDQPVQFTQLGVELIGSSSPQADAEAIILAIQGLQEVGLGSLHMRMGHMGTLLALMNHFGLSDFWQMFLMDNVQALQQGEKGIHQIKERAAELGFASTSAHTEDVPGPFEASPHEEALLGRVFSNLDLGPTGIRSPREIVERYIRKSKGWGTPESLDRCLRCLAELVSLKGSPERVLKSAFRVAGDAGLASSALQGIEDLFLLLKQCPWDSTTLEMDFGLVGEVGYYTGVVFELSAVPKEGVPASVGSGGRYDGLVRTLGGDRDVPSVGFAYDLDSLMGTAEAHGGQTTGTEQPRTPDHLVIPKSQQEFGPALLLAEQVRKRGKIVELEVCKRSLQESRSYAVARGIGSLIVVLGEGKIREYVLESR